MYIKKNYFTNLFVKGSGKTTDGLKVLASSKSMRAYEMMMQMSPTSFDRLKVIYKKVGHNESQAFGVWQQLSESERTAAFANT